MDKKLNEAVAALRPQMVAALQRLVRRRSVEADPLPGKKSPLARRWMPALPRR